MAGCFFGLIFMNGTSQIAPKWQQKLEKRADLPIQSSEM
jgi:hypothetical protein